MDWSLLWLIVSCVLGLGLIVLGVMTYRRQFVKRSLGWDFAISPVAPQVHGNRLTIAFDGKLLSDPYIMTFELESLSRADIPSSSFDAGKPITFTFGADIIGAALAEGDITASISGHQLMFEPQLIRKRASSEIGLIFDRRVGVPEVANPLIDIPLRYQLPDRYRRGNRMLNAVITVAGGLCVGLVAILITAFLQGKL
jgi:hypothetical protein